MLRPLRRTAGTLAIAATAILALQQPALAASCASEGDWRRSGPTVRIKANTDDTSLGWKVVQRKFVTFPQGSSGDVKTSKSNTMDKTLGDSLADVYSDHKLEFIRDTDRVNRFIVTFQRPDTGGNTLTYKCRIDFLGKKRGGSIEEAKFRSVACGEDDFEKLTANDSHVTCERNFNSGRTFFVIRLTLDN